MLLLLLVKNVDKATLSLEKVSFTWPKILDFLWVKYNAEWYAEFQINEDFGIVTELNLPVSVHEKAYKSVISQSL